MGFSLCVVMAPDQMCRRLLPCTHKNQHTAESRLRIFNVFTAKQIELKSGLGYKKVTIEPRAGQKCTAGHCVSLLKLHHLTTHL